MPEWAPLAPRGLAAALTFPVPLSEERATELVRALPLAPGHHVVELGCGRAELLLRVVGAHPGATGTGVDDDRPALDRGHREAARRGLQERVELVDGDVTTFEDHGALVLCIGAAHRFRGPERVLRRVRELVMPGGRALLGHRVWERSPGASARAAHGDLPVLDGLVAFARGAGFAVESADRSTPEEWEAFEAGVRAGLLAPGGADAEAAARDRARAYDATLRGVLGFAWLVLAPA